MEDTQAVPSLAPRTHISKWEAIPEFKPAGDMPPPQSADDGEKPSPVPTPPKFVVRGTFLLSG